MKTFQPNKGRALVKMVRLPEITDAGIFLPEAARDVTLLAEVVAIGPREEGLLSIAHGDTVMLTKYNSGTEIRLDGEQYFVVFVRDVLGVLKDA